MGTTKKIKFGELVLMNVSAMYLQFMVFAGLQNQLLTVLDWDLPVFHPG